LSERSNVSPWKIESAGTVGRQAIVPLDLRTLAVYRTYSVPLDHRSRVVVFGDFSRFDLLLVMDHRDLADLKVWGPSAFLGRLHLLGEFGVPAGKEIPDPGNAENGLAEFDTVAMQMETCLVGLLARYPAGNPVIGPLASQPPRQTPSRKGPL